MLEDNDSYGVLRPHSSQSDFIRSDCWFDAQGGDRVFISSYVAFQQSYWKPPCLKTP